MTSESWHISDRIDRPADEVYAYASNPANLPRWAPGLGNSVEEVDGQWFVETPAERVRFAFAPRNDLGVLGGWLARGAGAAPVVSDDAVADREQDRDLLVPRPAAEQVAVDEDYRRTAAVILVVKVDRAGILGAYGDDRHAFPPRSLWLRSRSDVYGDDFRLNVVDVAEDNRRVDEGFLPALARRCLRPSRFAVPQA